MRSAVIFNFLIEANIMASIAILLMIPLRKCFREQLGNGALCFGWLLVALRLLLPLSLVNPLIHEIRSPYAADEAIRPIAGQIKVRVTDAVSDLSNAFWRAENREAYNLTRSLSDRMYNASLSRTLVKIWLAGMVLAATWFLFVNIRFRLRLRAERIEPISGDLLDRYRAICSERGVRPVPVYYTDPLPSACLVGVLRPYIALPLSASPQDAVHVLTHEVCHLKNRDHLWNVLRLICCAVHWFNPLVWLAASMSRTDSELRCDDRVTQPMDEAQRRAYAGVLVLAAARRNAPGVGVLATGMTMTGKRLKTRVTAVMQKKPPLRWLTVAFVVLSSICLVGAFATSETKEQLEMGVGLTERYITDDLSGSRKLDTEEQALQYARELFEGLQSGEQGEPIRVSRSGENCWEAWIGPEDEAAVFFAFFRDDGVVITLSRVREFGSWRGSAGALYNREVITSSFMDPEEQEKVGRWVMGEIERLNPGAAGMLRDAEMVSVRISGDEKCIELHAEPKDSRYDLGAYLDCVLQGDGSIRLTYLTFAGNG